MAGFLLGAGSGVLAGAAVYYTISTSLAANTERIRQDLHHSAALLDSSFDKDAGPAPSAFVGPRPGPPTFSEVLKQRWNAAVGGVVVGARETDWAAVGEAAWDGARTAVDKLRGAADDAVRDARDERLNSPFAAEEATSLVDGAGSPAAAELDKLRHTTHVDRGLKASPAGIESPKRVV